MTYGEWVNEELGWHQNTHVLDNLYCGREHHVYVVLYNSLGIVYLPILNVWIFQTEF